MIFEIAFKCFLNGRFEPQVVGSLSSSVLPRGKLLWYDSKILTSLFRKPCQHFPVHFRSYVPLDKKHIFVTNRVFGCLLFGPSSFGVFGVLLSNARAEKKENYPVRILSTHTFSVAGLFISCNKILTRFSCEVGPYP